MFPAESAFLPCTPTSRPHLLGEWVLGGPYQLATELIFPVISSKCSERRDTRSWLFFCGANGMGSDLLKHYVGRWKMLWLGDCVSHLHPRDSLERCLLWGLQSCRKRSAPRAWGQMLLAVTPPSPARSEFPSSSHLFIHSCCLSSAIHMAGALTTPLAEVSDWGQIWGPHFWTVSWGYWAIEGRTRKRRRRGCQGCTWHMRFPLSRGSTVGSNWT